MASSRFVLRRATAHNALIGLAWLALAVVTLGAVDALFGDTFFRLLRTFKEPEFSHGYLIPVISGWLVWQRRHLLWSQRVDGAWTGCLVSAVGVSLAVLCHAANLLTPPYVAFLIVILGLSAAALGWASARYVIVPLAFMLFAYPLPDYAYIEISTSLQLISSQIGADVLDALGVPVFLDGNVIDLGTMKLQVAEACSGLRYLLPLISFGVLCAFIYRGPWWARFAVLLATVPLTIALNGIRIAMTGLFVHFGSSPLAEGFMHLFEGWVVFLLSLTVLFGLMYGLLRSTGWSGRIVDVLDFERMAGAPDGARPNQALARAAGLPPLALIAGTATVAAGTLFLIPLADRSAVIPARIGLLNYPMVLGDRVASPRFLDADTERRLGADDYVFLDFAHESAPPVNLWIAYYASLINGSYLHSPTTCLPGAGWEYVDFGAHQTHISDLSGDRLIVNRGEIVKDDERILMYFWMELRGSSLRELHYVKLINLWDSIVQGRTDGALVRIHTPLRPGEDVAAGDRRLMAFLERAYPHLRPHVGR